MVPPKIFSGYNYNHFDPSLIYVYDANAGTSGAYRALTPADFGGGGSPIAASVTGTQGPRSGNGAIFAAQERNILYIENIGINPLYIALSGTASPINYSRILKGGVVTGDGNGGVWETSSWYGAVSVSGVQPYYLAWEA